MNTSNILCLLCGSLISTLMFFLYSLHVECQNRLLIWAAKSSGYSAGYAKGYEDRAMISTTGKL